MMACMKSPVQDHSLPLAIKSQSEAELKTCGLLGLSTHPQCFLSRCINQYVLVHYLLSGIKCNMQQRRKGREKKNRFSLRFSYTATSHDTEVLYEGPVSMTPLSNKLQNAPCEGK